MVDVHAVAVFANVKTGEAFYAECGLSSNDDFILGIRFLDPQKNLFVIVKSIHERKSGWSGWEDYLHVVKLEGQKIVDTGWTINIGKRDRVSSDFPLYHKWFVHNNILFVYDNGKILCSDGGRAVSHPFSETFNDNADRIGTI